MNLCAKESERKSWCTYVSMVGLNFVFHLPSARIDDPCSTGCGGRLEWIEAMDLMDVFIRGVRFFCVSELMMSFFIC